MRALSRPRQLHVAEIVDEVEAKRRIELRTGWGSNQGTSPKMTDLPHAPGWRAHLGKAQATPRCGAKRRDGVSCTSPVMKNGRCRMHGGKSTGPRTPEGLERARRAR
jgi:hypothetical protein